MYHSTPGSDFRHLFTQKKFTSVPLSPCSPVRLLPLSLLLDSVRRSCQSTQPMCPCMTSGQRSRNWSSIRHCGILGDGNCDAIGAAAIAGLHLQRDRGIHTWNSGRGGRRGPHCVDIYLWKEMRAPSLSSTAAEEEGSLRSPPRRHLPRDW
nr:uncharacterized protein LOC127302245 [Lolium perenne]